LGPGVGCQNGVPWTGCGLKTESSFSAVTPRRHPITLKTNKRNKHININNVGSHIKEYYNSC